MANNIASVPAAAKPAAGGFPKKVCPKKILIVCAITYPCVIFRACPLLQETQRGSGCTVFLKATVIEPLRIRIKHSYHYFMIYQYEYMGCVYQKNTGIDLAYHQAQKKIGTEVEIYIDPSDPEKYFCPADVKMYRMTQICLLCCGWLAIVGTPIACFILEYLY